MDGWKSVWSTSSSEGWAARGGGVGAQFLIPSSWTSTCDSLDFSIWDAAEEAAQNCSEMSPLPPPSYIIQSAPPSLQGRRTSPSEIQRGQKVWVSGASSQYVLISGFTLTTLFFVLHNTSLIGNNDTLETKTLIIILKKNLMNVLSQSVFYRLWVCWIEN